MDIAGKIEKITHRTVPLYLIIILMILTAAPTTLGLIIGFPIVVAGEIFRWWAAGHIQKNEEITTSGPYGYIQSPLYLGSFVIMTGFSIMAQKGLLWLICTMIFFFSYVPRKQRTEWGRMERIFGEDFAEYKKNVNYFMPKSLTPYPKGHKHPWSFAAAIENTEHQTGIVVLLIALFIKMDPMGSFFS